MAASAEQQPLLSPKGHRHDIESHEVYPPGEQQAGDSEDSDGYAGDGVNAHCREIPPKICSKLVSRIKAMVLRLLPVQLESDDITAANGSILTPAVIDAFYLAGGDFKEAVPYCLLVARQSFHKDAYRNPSDFDEHMNHKLACEVLARRVIQKFPQERQHTVLLERFAHIESDGDESLPLSAIEIASDLHCPIFLSSAESQKTIYALWKGHLVQSRDEKGHVIYDVWRREGGLDPSRLGVPRYQNILRVVLWIVFIACYSLAIKTPDREFGLEDYIFYIQVAGYTLEEIVRFIKIRSIAALSFWTCISLSIYTLSFVALGYRIADLTTHDTKKALEHRQMAFKYLSCAAPLVWAKLTTVFDLFSFFGTMQIVVGRMMKESAVFFALLTIMAIGFLQALIGLDYADDAETDAASTIVHSLLQGLLGSPNFDTYADKGLSYPFGMILYYAWSILTLIILLNILIALFNSAYENVTEDAISQYMAFFSQKTISAVRAPDQFVYVAPFNLLEILFLPLEFCLPADKYAALNRVVLTVLFFPVLCGIALFERHYEKSHQKAISLADEDFEEEVEEDPEVDEADGQISKVSFKELVKNFPDAKTSTTSQILTEIKRMQKELDSLKEAAKVKKEED